MSESVEPNISDEPDEHVDSGVAVLQAPAKINLHLGILGRRPDGFHEIQSLFHRIDLMDTLRIERTEPGGGCVLHGNFSIPTPQNIMYTAYTLFRDRTATDVGVRIDVEKRIPMGAGLGGGSSDAAAVLMGLNRLYRTGLSYPELSEMGALLGSDVPFFLAEGAAWVTGRGERVRLLQARDDLSVLLATPEFGIASKDAYSWIDSAVEAGESLFERSLAELGYTHPWEPFYGSPHSWPYANTFLPVVIRHRPVIGTIMEWFRQAGADYSSLTGSGSTVFGIFEDTHKAHKAVEYMQEIPGIRVWEGKLLARTA